jgi:hypothetical protein
VTIVFGILLIVLGIIGFVGTGSQHPTALIPAFFGLPIAICGIIALNPAAKKHAMHIAVLVGAIGLIGSLVMIIKVIPTLLRGQPLARPPATLSQAVMLILTSVFVFLCVRSFIAARRTRLAATPADAARDTE